MHAEHMSSRESFELQKLTPEAGKESGVAGEPMTTRLTRTPGNNALGGLKVVAGSGLIRGKNYEGRVSLMRSDISKFSACTSWSFPAV